MSKNKNRILVSTLIVMVYLIGIPVSYLFIQACSNHLDFADFRLFWGIGQAIVAGKVDLVYPPLGASTFEGTIFPIDVPFLYPPNFAAATVIFSGLPMISAYAITRGILAFSVLVSGLIFSQIVKDKKVNLVHLFLVPLLFFPVAESIGIGQLSLILYVLPILLGAHLLLTEKPYWAGLVFGVVCFKPQPLIGLLAVLICLALFESEIIKKRMRLIAGFGTTAAVNVVIALSTFGLEGVFRWLNCVKMWMNNYVYGDIKYFEPYWLICSLPMVIGQSIKSALPEVFSPLLPQGFSFLVLLVEVALIFFFVSRARVTLQIKFETALSLVILTMPIFAPYMRVYDLGAYLIPFWFLFFGEIRYLNEFKMARFAALLSIVIIDLHLLLVPQQLASGFKYGNLFVVTTCFALWLCFVTGLLKATKKENSEVES